MRKLELEEQIAEQECRRVTALADKLEAEAEIVKLKARNLRLSGQNK